MIRTSVTKKLDSVLQEQIDRPLDYILVKLAMRCNLACTYCYWFRDDTVFDKPNLMLPSVETAFLLRLREHLLQHSVPYFRILFHGGEPLLFGKERFVSLCESLKQLSIDTATPIQLAITTNGVLLDEEWVGILKKYDINVTVSLDGPSVIHDASRVDLKGGGTFGRVVAGIRLLQQEEVDIGLLAVYQPGLQPQQIFDLFFEELGVKHFNVLIPDATHSDIGTTDLFADFFIELFSLWFEVYAEKGVRIPFCSNAISGLLGNLSKTESFGLGPVSTATVLTDGSIEPLDVARIVEHGFTATNCNVLGNKLQDIKKDPLWKEIVTSSLNLNEQCKRCSFKTACGGGHITSRWSPTTRFDNPSVHCSELLKLFRELWNIVLPHIIVKEGGGS